MFSSGELGIRRIAADRDRGAWSLFRGRRQAIAVRRARYQNPTQGRVGIIDGTARAGDQRRQVRRLFEPCWSRGYLLDGRRGFSALLDGSERPQSGRTE